MVITVHQTKWKDEAVRRRILDYARRKAEASMQRVTIRLDQGARSFRKIAVIQPW